MLTNIRLGWKWVAVPSTLAFNAAALITDGGSKRFYGPRVYTIKLFTKVINFVL